MKLNVIKTFDLILTCQWSHRVHKRRRKALPHLPSRRLSFIPSFEQDYNQLTMLFYGGVNFIEWSCVKKYVCICVYSFTFILDYFYFTNFTLFFSKPTLTRKIKKLVKNKNKKYCQVTKAFSLVNLLIFCFRGED